jgi:hypothetical protein
MQSSEADKVMPPENGKRARIDSATGAVHGSGVGAGGGGEGEDFDCDGAAGDDPVPQPGSPRPRITKADSEGRFQQAVR